MASITPRLKLQRLAGSLPNIFQSNQNKIVVGVFVDAFVACWKNYRDWQSEGPSGVSPSVKGWVLQWLAGLYASSDTKTTGCYTNLKFVQVYGNLGAKRFLVGDLPVRAGDRAVLLPWAIPHLQAPGTESGSIVRNVGIIAFRLPDKYVC